MSSGHTAPREVPGHGAQPFVLVAHAAGTGVVRSRVTAELQLLRYGVREGPNAARAVQDAVQQRRAAAVVWIRSERHIELWFLQSDVTTAPQRHVVSAGPRESRELLALRAVELLRSGLIPLPVEEPAAGPPGGGDSGDRPLPKAQNTDPTAPSWSSALGAGIIAGEGLSATVGASAEVHLWPWRHLAFGLIARTTLAPHTQDLPEAAAEVGQRWIAPQVRLRWPIRQPWSLEAAIAAGWRQASTSWAPEDRAEGFHDSASGLLMEAEVGACWQALAWLGLRGTGWLAHGSELSFRVRTGPEQAEGDGDGQWSELSLRSPWGVAVYGEAYF